LRFRDRDERSGDPSHLPRWWVADSPAGKLGAEREESDYLKPKDSDGCVADFHSLCHGFIRYLGTANVPPKVTQTLARHSTITLTMDQYTHLGVSDLLDALTQLPTITPDSGSGPATGTSG
jgi:hypothetical protein